MADPVIRPVRPGEFEAVGTLTVRAYMSLPDFNNDTGYEDELRDVAGRARDAEVYVAEVSGALVGAITFVADSTSAMSEWDDPLAAGIRMLAIAPDVQGAGLGYRLTLFAIERARALGKTRLLLHSTSFMHSAHRLYEGMGFRRLPEIDFSVETVELWGFELLL